VEEGFEGFAKEELAIGSFVVEKFEGFAKEELAMGLRDGLLAQDGFVEEQV
jgi:hypothetical protein